MKNTWSLYKWQDDSKYPSVYYFWVDEKNIVRFIRSVEPIGFMPFPLPFGISTGESINQMRFTPFGIKKVYMHKMNDEQLKQGWLNL